MPPKAAGLAGPDRPGAVEVRRGRAKSLVKGRSGTRARPRLRRPLTSLPWHVRKWRYVRREASRWWGQIKRSRLAKSSYKNHNKLKPRVLYALQSCSPTGPVIGMRGPTEALPRSSERGSFACHPDGGAGDVVVVSRLDYRDDIGDGRAGTRNQRHTCGRPAGWVPPSQPPEAAVNLGPRCACPGPRRLGRGHRRCKCVDGSWPACGTGAVPAFLAAR